MSNLDIKVRNIDDDTLFTHKQVRVGSKKIETPIKAISIGKTRTNDSIALDARGFNEIYFETDPTKLETAQEEFSSNLKKNVRNQLNKTQDGEINAVFVNLKTIKPISRPNLEYLADLVYSTSDFVPVPLMPDLLQAIKEDGQGTSSRYFNIYLEITQQFIEIARQINGKPVMGTIPTLPRAFINRVIDIYMDKRVRAFCFNFNGRTVTAEAQLTDMVAPLMRRIAVQDMEEDVLFYSLNAHRGRSTKGSDYIPARDFLSFGFGMDVLGDKHTGGNLPPHLYEKIEESAPTFRLFHRNDYVYQNYEYGNDLRSHLPTDTGLSADRILNRPDHGYRLATLLNGEQQSKETRDLRPAIDEYRVVDHIETKQGVGPDDLQSMKDTKDQFQSNQSQSSLSSLDDQLG